MTVAQKAGIIIGALVAVVLVIVGIVAISRYDKLNRQNMLMNIRQHFRGRMNISFLEDFSKHYKRYSLKPSRSSILIVPLNSGPMSIKIIADPIQIYTTASKVAYVFSESYKYRPHFIQNEYKCILPNFCFSK